MNRATGRTRHLLADQSGVVFVEFLMAFVPVWTFFLCVVQLAFLAPANLMVKNAADSAARSAVVVLPDDAREYGGETEMSVARASVTSGDISRALERVGSGLQKSPSTDNLVAVFSDETLANIGRSRLNTIRLAAHARLMPLAPIDVGNDTEPSIAKSIGGRRKLLSALYYQPFALAVTFPGVSGEVVTGPEVTVRVTYAFQCTVPFARHILCDDFGDVDALDALHEVFVPFPQRFVGGRFRSLQHETTLMVQDAPYEYRKEGSA